jgi:MATE family multidrug resistance protein
MSTSINTSKSYLLKLSIPIFFSNIALPFAGLVDTGLMGHLNDEKFLAALAIATSAITMIFWSFGFLRMGTVGLVANALGRKDYSEIIQVLIRNLILAVLIGFIIIFLKDSILFSIKYFLRPQKKHIT